MQCENLEEDLLKKKMLETSSKKSGEKQLIVRWFLQIMLEEQGQKMMRRYVE